VTRCTWARRGCGRSSATRWRPAPFVVCHDTLTYGDFPDYGPAICRGFVSAYADRSPALILLRAFQRLVEVPPPDAAAGPRN
jgi:hypothetical protein